MITNKYLTKIIAVIMAALVCLCILASFYSENIKNLSSYTQKTSLEYETKLFSNDNIIDVNIIMDDDDWDNMLENAIKEEYTKCDVEINGQKFYNVGIRPKGNTSLTSIVNDPDSDRYSFKIEFDHYVDGQTCFGLNKLVLNNNYADATNMKEALVYDMYKFIGADASLSNYAKISHNGNYWGVYLALESVDESFMIRNYGVQNGELYKPDGMNMAGGSDNGRGFGKDKNDADEKKANGMPPKNDDKNFGAPPPEMNSDGNFPENMPNMNEPPSDMSSDSASGSSAETNIPTDSKGRDFGGGPGGGPGGGGPGDFGGRGSQGGGNLNYIDDDTDNYSTIWDGEVTNASKKDKKKVVKALKNISEKNNLDQYMDIDNLTKYMAVHIFSVNEDSLSGNMAHNYYLYESGGKLNIIPWDYNLAWGGMHGGGASDVVNSPIDNSFSATNFFDGIFEDSEYLSEYHSEMKKLVDEYVNGGKFDEFYSKTRNMIDELIKDDPTAFYTYDEYDKAATMLYNTIKLRAESISGQLDGSIPSTKEAQNSDSSSLIDSSEIDTSVMGSMMGGGPGRSKFDPENLDVNKENANTDKTSESAASENNSDMQPLSDAQTADRHDFRGGGRPPEMNNDMQNNKTDNTVIYKNLLYIGISVIIIIACILFAFFMRRKTR